VVRRRLHPVLWAARDAAAGLIEIPSTVRVLSTVLSSVGAESGRLAQSAEEISRLAVFTDRTEGDPPGEPMRVTSYYQLGAAIALSLDLSLRERSGGRLSLDDFMREMWRRFGKPGGAREGYVDHPYTIADAKRRWRRSAATPRSPTTFSPATSRDASSPITDACSRRPVFLCGPQRAGR